MKSRMNLLTKTPVDSESRLSYPGWRIVLAGFFGVMVSFVAANGREQIRSAI
jgi:hypothetical protein